MRDLTRESDVVSISPVVTPIPFRDPAAAFAPFAGEAMAVLLDSALVGPRARFSYIATDPVRTIRCTSHPWIVTVDGLARAADPFATVKAELAGFSANADNYQGSGPAPFLGGAVGFFSYELGGVLEPAQPPKDKPWPVDMVIGIYDTIAAFDLERKHAWVIAHDLPGVGGRRPAATRADALARDLGTAVLPAPQGTREGRWRAETPRAVHEMRVGATIEAIQSGDIYQANISQRFLADIPEGISSFDLYLRLRSTTPAPFAAFINAGDGLQILSASPERFLKLDPDGNVETRPIKGTRPRGKNAADDQRLAAELLASTKDRAENLMIVDLLRNDLARVCTPGSIKVPVLCGLETFPNVHHLVSVVTGRLRAGITSTDLLCATFPGGSVTGAPKIKAMEVIRGLEPTARGPYCGTIAWLGFDGAMDSSIVIRTLVPNGRSLVAQAGGGIVAESDPAQEYEESLAKVRPLLGIFGNGVVA